MKPLLIDAVLGNSRLLATLTHDGEIQRLFWPHVDGPQHVERIRWGLTVDGGFVTWQDTRAWTHTQAYERDQNVLVTVSSLPAGLEVESTDAALPGRDILIRRVRITNRGAAPRTVKYALYQWIRVDENPRYNTALFDEESDSLVHYRRNVYIAAAADRELSGYAVNYPDPAFQQASELAMDGGGPLHGDVASAGVWDLGALAPGASVELTLYWALGHSIQEVRQLLASATSVGGALLLDEVRAYWSNWLSRARAIDVPDHAASADQIQELYRRSLLTFKLMADEQSGAVIAAPEFDPAYQYSGGYAYCWGRDAAYITTAMDYAGYHDLAGAFYRWAVGAQEPEGWWMHRHYATGHWAPSWGLIQVDETGSILFGMAIHAQLHGGTVFAREVWPSVARAADWLIGNMDPETGLTRPAVDLWEERTAELTYSCAAVFAGLRAAAELAEMLGHTADGARYLRAAEALRHAVLAQCVRGGRFLRGRYLQVSREKYEQALAHGQTVRVRAGVKGNLIYELVEDPVPDSSLFAMSTPFRLVEPQDEVMEATSAALVEALWKGPGGGMLRYVGDHYRGGQNPWVLCTLWLGQYELDRGNRDRALQILDWAVARRTATGLLAEQVDPVTGAAVWVVPLTWSHAMYVLLALQLYGA